MSKPCPQCDGGFEKVQGHCELCDGLGKISKEEFQRFNKRSHGEVWFQGWIKNADGILVKR